MEGCFHILATSFRYPNDRHKKSVDCVDCGMLSLFKTGFINPFNFNRTGEWGQANRTLTHESARMVCGKKGGGTQTFLVKIVGLIPFQLKGCRNFYVQCSYVLPA
jgi:hypothetical protein